jgi:hypothetical protein
MQFTGKEAEMNGRRYQRSLAFRPEKSTVRR